MAEATAYVESTKRMVGFTTLHVILESDYAIVVNALLSEEFNRRGWGYYH